MVLNRQKTRLRTFSDSENKLGLILSKVTLTKGSASSNQGIARNGSMSTKVVLNLFYYPPSKKRYEEKLRRAATSKYWG